MSEPVIDPSDGPYLEDIAEAGLSKPIDKWSLEELLAATLMAMDEIPDDICDVDIVRELAKHLEEGDFDAVKKRLRSVSEMWMARRAMEALSEKEEEEEPFGITGAAPGWGPSPGPQPTKIYAISSSNTSVPWNP